jgi:hypothetical protein
MKWVHELLAIFHDESTGVSIRKMQLTDYKLPEESSGIRQRFEFTYGQT